MKKMIVTLFFSSLAFSTLAVAEEADGRLEDFKQKMTQHIDKEIEVLTQFKTCIQAAQVRADFEVCRKAKNEAQKKNLAEMKAERMENRKKRLANEEKRLNEETKADKK